MSGIAAIDAEVADIKKILQDPDGPMWSALWEWLEADGNDFAMMTAAEKADRAVELAIDRIVSILRPELLRAEERIEALVREHGRRDEALEAIMTMVERETERLRRLTASLRGGAVEASAAAETTGKE